MVIKEQSQFSVSVILLNARHGPTETTPTTLKWWDAQVVSVLDLVVFAALDSIYQTLIYEWNNTLLVL